MQTNIIDEEKINEIRNSIDIVEIISNYVPLTTRGKNFFGICPFHSDHSPSMSVSKEKQIYTCFSCGASGNVFNFLMDYENINFIEAVQICADKAGIPLLINKTIKNNKNQDLYDIFELAQKFYVNNINTNYGLEAKKYLEERKINSECIKEFGVGLSLSKEDLLMNLLVNKGYKADTIEKTGLILKRKQGYIDMYINRIMFPLYDLTGKIVGYSGRIYNSSSSTKYFNTRETEIFKKGEILYNYHRAKDFVREKKQLIIVEGFMDVIRLYSVGIKNVMAMMGTAVTKQQALIIKRLNVETILCFDGDNAGAEATNSCINELNKIGITPKVVRLENNLDPDEYILNFGKEKFLQKINNAINCMEYKMRYLQNNLDLTDNFGMAKYVDTVINELSKIENETYIEISLKKLSQESNLDIEYLKNKLKGIETKEIKKEVIKPTIIKDKYEKLEQQLVYYMLNDKNVVKKFIEDQVFLRSEIYRKLAREISLFYKEKGNVGLADFITYFKDSEFEKIIKELMISKINDNYDNNVINEIIKSLKERNIKENINSLQEKMRMETDNDKKIEYFKEMIKLKQMEE